MIDKQRVLVVIPAYNCGPQIGRVIDQFEPDLAHTFDQVIVVNNRSTDQTESAAIAHMRAKPYLNSAVLRNEDNLGYGGSLKVGIQYARDGGFDWLVVLHGDDQGTIRDLVPHLNPEAIRDRDCILGARFHPESRIEGYSLFRRIGNVVFNWLFSIAAGQRLYDLGSGLNAYRVSIFDNRYYAKLPDNLTFDYCGVLAHAYYRRRIVFVPISWREDDQISNVRLFSQALSSLTLLMKFVCRRGRFFTDEHRASPRDVYPSETVYEQTAERAP